MRRSFRFAWLVGLVLLIGCSDSNAPPSTSEQVVVGDTTIIRPADPLWGDSVTLIEEMTIGVLDGAPEYQFGRIPAVTVDASGGVYVFDSHVPALRYYDRDGAWVRTLGREGQGPGEYYDVALGLTVRTTDGRIVMWDPRNLRLNLYEPDGTPSDSWPVPSGLYSANAMVRDTADHLYLKILMGPIETGKPWPVGVMHVGADGQVLDSLAPPTLEGEPEADPGRFGTTKLWAFSPLRGFVLGLNDRYRFEHRREDGTVLRVERSHTPVRLHPTERPEYRADSGWLDRAREVGTPDIPEVKPAYHSFKVGENGRIWVQRHVEVEQVDVPESASEAPPPPTWREPSVYDVYEPDGALLGTIRMPPRTSPMFLRGDLVWAVRTDAFDVPQVVRFRIRGGG